MSRIKYFFGQAKKNIVRNGLMSVASIVTIISCLVILGIFTIISLNIDHVTEQIKDQCEIQIYMDLQTPEERVLQIKSEIEAISNIKSVELYTKEQILDEVRSTMFEGYEDLVDSFSGEDNPFADSYKIILHDISLANQTADELSKIENIDKVTNKQDVVNMVVSLSSSVRIVTIVIMLVLLLVAIVIISNTVRLTVFNRRKEIGIMKYIGATDRFIRMPFVFEGIIIGFSSAVMSLVIMSTSYWFLLDYMNKSNFELFTIVGIVPVTASMAVIFIVVGSLIGMLGSLISMKKYLKV